MSDVYQPTENLTPAEIATFATALRNHPVPAPVAGIVRRQEPGRVNSPNEAGGYIGPDAFERR